MDIFSGIVLGAVQGLTEFLPISSSGHLILAREVLGISTSYDLAVDALLHFATAAAVLIYFRWEFWKIFTGLFGVLKGKVMERESLILFWALLLGTIPAVVFGLLLEKQMETIFRNAQLIAWTLIAGSLVMWAAERLAKQTQSLSIKKGIAIGFFQVLALIPGMSRSGMTISGGLFLGLSREQAARFAFILGFPVLFGAGLKKFYDLTQSGVLSTNTLSLSVATLTAFITGIIAIHYLLRFLRTNTLGIFIVYRLALAVFILILL